MSQLSTEGFVPTESLRDKVLVMLRHAIVSGEIKVDEVYSATALAKDLGTSVSPVREAMLTLVNEGIMETVRNRGFRVTPMTAQAMADIYELRVLLEVPTVAKLATLDISDAMPDLHSKLDAMDEFARDADLVEFLQADRAFHLELLRLAGNERLMRFVETLRDQTRLYGMKSYAPGLVESAAEHRAIVVAIEAGDEARTSTLMADHLAHITRDWSGPRTS